MTTYCCCRRMHWKPLQCWLVLPNLHFFQWQKNLPNQQCDGWYQNQPGFHEWSWKIFACNHWMLLWLPRHRIHCQWWQSIVIVSSHSSTTQSNLLLNKNQVSWKVGLWYNAGGAAIAVMVMNVVESDATTEWLDSSNWNGRIRSYSGQSKRTTCSSWMIESVRLIVLLWVKTKGLGSSFFADWEFWWWWWFLNFDQSSQSHFVISRAFCETTRTIGIAFHPVSNENKIRSQPLIHWSPVVATTIH